MVRSNRRIFLTSFIVSILVFAGGILLGYSLDNFRGNALLENLKQSELNTESYITEQSFLESFGKDKCNLISPRVSILTTELGEIGRLLISLEQKGMFGSEYNYLKQKYSILEIKVYTIFNELEKKCDFHPSLILFFYDPEDQDSKNQGQILDVFVKSKEDIHVFSLDRTFQKDPLLETVKLYYNITKSPALVINGVKKEGLINLEEIEQTLKNNGSLEQ